MEREGRELSLESKNEILMGITYTAWSMVAAERISLEQAALAILKASIILCIESDNGRAEVE